MGEVLKQLTKDDLRSLVGQIITIDSSKLKKMSRGNLEHIVRRLSVEQVKEFLINPELIN